jgi:hypothetical protein
LGRAVRIGSVYAAQERSREMFFSNSMPSSAHTFYTGVTGWRD